MQLEKVIAFPLLRHIIKYIQTIRTFNILSVLTTTNNINYNRLFCQFTKNAYNILKL